MSAVADATDNAVNTMVCCDNDDAEEARIEHRRVTIIIPTPNTQVSTVSSGVLIRGEDGLGKDARAEVC